MHIVNALASAEVTLAGVATENWAPASGTPITLSQNRRVVRTLRQTGRLFASCVTKTPEAMERIDGQL